MRCEALFVSVPAKIKKFKNRIEAPFENSETPLLKPPLKPFSSPFEKPSLLKPSFKPLLKIEFENSGVQNSRRGLEAPSEAPFKGASISSINSIPPSKIQMDHTCTRSHAVTTRHQALSARSLRSNYVQRGTSSAGSAGQDINECCDQPFQEASRQRPTANLFFKTATSVRNIKHTSFRKTPLTSSTPKSFENRRI